MEILLVSLVLALVVIVVFLLPRPRKVEVPAIEESYMIMGRLPHQNRIEAGSLLITD